MAGNTLTHNAHSNSVRCIDDSLLKYLKNLCGSQSLENIDFKYYLKSEFNSLNETFKDNIDISVFHINIRSLNANQADLLQLLYCIDNDFDIIVLSEIWSYNIEFYCNLLRGYTLIHDLPTNSERGGLGLFIQKKMYN